MKMRVNNSLVRCFLSLKMLEDFTIYHYSSLFITRYCKSSD